MYWIKIVILEYRLSAFTSYQYKSLPCLSSMMVKCVLIVCTMISTIYDMRYAISWEKKTEIVLTNYIYMRDIILIVIPFFSIPLYQLDIVLDKAEILARFLTIAINIINININIIICWYCLLFSFQNVVHQPIYYQ